MGYSPRDCKRVEYDLVTKPPPPPPHGDVVDFIASQYFAITNSQTSVLDNRLLFYGEIQ